MAVLCKLYLWLSKVNYTVRSNVLIKNQIENFRYLACNLSYHFDKCSQGKFCKLNNYVGIILTLEKFEFYTIQPLLCMFV